MITEFGGISMSTDEESWGYETVGSTEEYAARLTGLFDALRASPEVVGLLLHAVPGHRPGDERAALRGRAPRSSRSSRSPEIVTGREDAGADGPSSTFGWASDDEPQEPVLAKEIAAQED